MQAHAQPSGPAHLVQLVLMISAFIGAGFAIVLGGVACTFRGAVAV